MDKRSESQFDYNIKEHTGEDFSAMPNKHTAPGVETREQVMPANVPLKHLIKHGDNPVSGDDIAVSREVTKYRKEKQHGTDKIAAFAFKSVGGNKGKAKDVAKAAKSLREVPGIRKY